MMPSRKNVQRRSSSPRFPSSLDPVPLTKNPPRSPLPNPPRRKQIRRVPMMLLMARVKLGRRPRHLSMSRVVNSLWQ